MSARKNCPTLVRALIACFGLCLVPIRGFAQEAWEAYVYETPEPGANEFALKVQHALASDRTTSFGGETIAKDQLTVENLEWQHGFTSQFSFGGYLDLANRPGETAFVAARLEAQYKFANAGDHFFDTALNFEYIVPKKDFLDEPESFEVRLILVKQFDDFELRFNEVSEKELVGKNPEGLTLGTSSGFYWRRYDVFQPGFEYHGRFGELRNLRSSNATEQVALAVVTSNFANDYSVRLGGGPGLTGASDRWVAQLLLTYEPAPSADLGRTVDQNR